jgi:hypothetical protein
MNLKNQFDISRFWLLLNMELFRSKKAIMMTLGITFGLLFAGLLLEAFFGDKTIHESHPGNYAFTFLTGGFILSSLAFNDLGNTLRRSHYLTLPVSALEKCLCMWLLTCLSWTVMFTMIYSIYTVIVNGAGHLLFSHVTYQKFNPLGEIPVKTIQVYFVLQGIFLVGAVYFKGYVFPKTIFTLLLSGMVLAVIVYCMLADVFIADHDCSSDECELLKVIKTHYVLSIVQWMFYWLLAPLCWMITYFGLKEQEV